MVEGDRKVVVSFRVDRKVAEQFEELVTYFEAQTGEQLGRSGAMCEIISELVGGHVSGLGNSSSRFLRFIGENRKRR